MTNKLKIIILALAILLVVSLLLIFSIQGSKSKLLREYNLTKQNLTEENQQLQGRLQSVLAENNSLQEKLAVVQDDLERILSEKDQLQQQYEIVSKEREKLLGRIGSYSEMEKSLELSQDKNQGLLEQITVLEKQRAALIENFKKVKSEQDDFKEKIAKAKEILQKRPSPSRSLYADSEELTVTKEAGVWSVDLPPIVVSPQVGSSGGSSLVLSGKILNINTDYAFVVIDLGRQMGVREGMVFDVFRMDQRLGSIEVIQLREKIAACDVVSAERLFQAGDTVRY